LEVETLAQSIVEQCQQLLECRLACLCLGCPESDLRHPALDFLPGSIPLRLSGSGARDIWDDERVCALRDLAIQSGHMQTFHQGLLVRPRERLHSLAVVPLERPAGLLGTLLLADHRPARFSEGEERLLYAYLSIQVAKLEQALWERARHDATRIRLVHDPVPVPDLLPGNELASMVGHELRAPLSVIKGYTGLLQEYGEPQTERQVEELSPERQHHYLDVIMRQTNLLEGLLTDLLDLSRLQHGKLVLQLMAVDAAEVCQRVIQLGRLRAEQREEGKYQLVCRLPNQLPAVMADANRLQQVLFNLLENAIKYSPEGGRIELEICVVNDQVEQTQVSFTVRDYGLGMPSQQFTRLFQPFERLQQPAGSHIPGSGLGLYIVRTIVEAMHGQIDLWSREGVGTAVTIILPATDWKQTSKQTASAQFASHPIG
jgi:signal transduction histidine kinase